MVGWLVGWLVGGCRFLFPFRETCSRK